MIKSVLIIAILILCFNLAQSQSLGIIVGEPTGISARWNHVDAGVAWSFVEERFLDVHADCLFMTQVFKENDERGDVYYGIGGRVIFQDNERYGFRIPVGLLYQIQQFEVFGEIAPIFDIYPASEFRFNIGIGIRYIF